MRLFRFESVLIKYLFRPTFHFTLLRKIVRNLCIHALTGVPVWDKLGDSRFFGTAQNDTTVSFQDCTKKRLTNECQALSRLVFKEFTQAEQESKDASML